MVGLHAQTRLALCRYAAALTASALNSSWSILPSYDSVLPILLNSRPRIYIFKPSVRRRCQTTRNSLLSKRQRSSYSSASAGSSRSIPRLSSGCVCCVSISSRKVKKLAVNALRQLDLLNKLTLVPQNPINSDALQKLAADIVSEMRSELNVNTARNAVTNVSVPQLQQPT
ncbi:hypothetical protein C8Q80DRAFT_767863 [Daedaleopsis nitida]|nr:hypothetical protein C8Q80DRAFT_767863 [Daedaleopsis nitida]